MIGLIAVTAAGRAAASRLSNAWPSRTRYYEGTAKQALPLAWAQCEEIVCFLAVGATVRLIAPMLQSKWSDPAVVCVDEATHYAVPLVGGHVAGANELAARVAAVLGSEPVITTATDSAGLGALDMLGWPAEGALAAVSRALLDGHPVALEADATWPIPPLPPTVGEDGECRIVITDRIIPLDERTVVLRPPSLVAGVGASKGVGTEEILWLVSEALTMAGLSAACLTCLATVEAKAHEPGLVTAARERGLPLLTYPAAQLATVPVPSPSERVLAAVGTPSVAEAAALSRGDDLVVPKRRSAHATVAIARIRPRGRLALVGLGPGALDLLTPRAVDELQHASVVVGLDRYLETVRGLLRPGTEVLSSGLGEEESRARTAVQCAQQGHAVALVGSGDAGVYAMASPALALAGEDIDVVGVPGISADVAAAALLGAPLGHDHAAVSLSDLHTPWEVIERRVRAAAEGDFVVALYNPRSATRDWQLGAALAVLAQHRPPETPVGVVRDAQRPNQQVQLTTLAALDPVTVDMHTLVIVGSSATQVVAGRMVTPRGYQWS
ncbi:MAG TPA: precorrin-3B C(17)-methyltransferase [Streptosporangiaceae bacterium]|nr:precorrin-3B C(17)-methyltransferase [Streptosporangiaceae bacterium]